MNRCRTLLFIPGNNPGMLANAASLGADMAIFDLEDAVAQAEKDAARILVRNALTYIKPQNMNVVVRSNALDTPYWRRDIAAAVQGGADFILMPKCSVPDDIYKTVATIEKEEQKRAIPGPHIQVLALVETSAGIENAVSLAQSHPRLVGMQLGAEDLTAELGAKRTPKGDELIYARSRIIMACKSAGIKALDTPYPFVTDLEGLKEDAAFSAQLGFDGKTVISPHHVALVNEAFTPSEGRIRWAKRVMAAAARAKEEGKGAVSLDGMMIDLPIIKRADRILSRVTETMETPHA